MKLVKSDKLIGGIHRGANLLPVYEFSIGNKETETFALKDMQEGTYVIEYVAEEAGPNPITIKVNGETYNSRIVSGYSNIKVKIPEGEVEISFYNSTEGRVSLKDTRLYLGDAPSVDLIPLTAQSARETKESNLNNWFIEVDLPLTYKDDIKQGYIIYTDTKSKKDQPFRIHNVEITNRRIRVVANHVVFDTMNYTVVRANTAGKPVAGAVSILNQSLDRESPFKISSTVELQVDRDFELESYYDALIHIVSLLGLYVDIDGFNIIIRSAMGDIKGTLEYGDNIQSIKVYENWDGVVTKLFPIGPDGITLPEKYLEGSVKYDEVYSKVITFESELELVDEDEEGNPIDNLPLLISELRENAQMYLERNQVPKVAYIISSDVPQDLDVFDYVQVKHPAITNNLPLDVEYDDVQAYNYFILVQVTKYEYNILSGMTEKLEYGEYASTIKKILGEVEKEIEDKVGDKLIDQEQQLKDQTDRINNWNKNGHVIQLENEILVVDTLPKENAKDVLKIGIGGIGFSSTGIDGTFTSAWGLNSQFNADFITAGTLEGSLLRVGSIESDHLSVEAIDMIVSLSKTGGTNIIKNSIGLGGLKEPWKHNSPRITANKPDDYTFGTVHRPMEGMNTNWNETYISSSSTSGYKMFLKAPVVTAGRPFYVKVNNEDSLYWIDVQAFDSSNKWVRALTINDERGYIEFPEGIDKIGFSIQRADGGAISGADFIFMGPEVGVEGINSNWESVQTTWSLQSIGKNALHFSGGGVATMYQDVELQTNKIHTLSAKVLKNWEGGVSLSLQYFANETMTGEPVVEYRWFNSNGEQYDGEVVIRIPHEPYRYARVNILSAGQTGVQIADLLLVEGSGTYWTQAPGEIYGSDVTFDADGIKVARRSENGEIVGHTIMSPQEFAGYYNNEKVFTLNADITEVMGLEVKGKGLFIRPVKMVQNDSGNGSLDIVWTGKG